jgi:pimeloyl-ACP methyl ester carboxylesterase/ribosomal protein S18 acetylase RimI-like enzyme
MWLLALISAIIGVFLWVIGGLCGCKENVRVSERTGEKRGAGGDTPAEHKYMLEPVSKSNITELRKISVLPAQSRFVADIDSSLIQASFLKNWHGFAFRADGVVVGFGSYASYDKVPGAHKIYKMIIDKNHQARGYGTVLLRMLVDAAPAGDLYIDVHTANTVAVKMYSKIFKMVSDDGETTVMKLERGLNTRACGNSTAPLVILIPGLGNGIESYNWNLSTPEQRKIVGIESAESLQDMLAEKYRVITFDPPGTGENTSIRARTLDEYTDWIRSATAADGREHNPTATTIVVGHSIGARVAQWYAKRFGGKCVLLDPTPEWIIREMVYTKHLDNPGVLKYQVSHDYISMVRAEVDRFAELPANAVVYSIDDNDGRRERKAEYFAAFPAGGAAPVFIRMENATHWVHVHDPARVAKVIGDVARE